MVKKYFPHFLLLRTYGFGDIFCNAAIIYPACRKVF